MVNHSTIFRSALMALALFFYASAGAEEQSPPFNAHDARSAIAALDRDQTILAHFQACPADVFRKEATLGALLLGDTADVTTQHCAQHPFECFSGCAARRSGEHCFHLARAFQDHEQTVEPRYAQMMYQMACARGVASGCTNRAAHLRNAAHEGDPLTSLTQEAQEKCEFRSFSVACEKDDPWGCAMLGQAYRNGEGVNKSRSLAQRSYEKSCRLDPDFAACDFARTALGKMATRKRRRR